MMMLLGCGSSGAGGPAANSAEAQQFYDRMFTPPTPGSALEARWNAFIDGGVADGWWAKLDAINLWFAGDTEGDAHINLIQNDYHTERAQWTGVTTFHLHSGIDGGAAGHVIRSNFNPSTAVGANFQRDDHCAFVWIGNNVVLGRTALDDGTISSPAVGSNNKIEIWPRYNVGGAGYFNACGTEKAVSGITDSSGFHYIERTAASGAGAAKWFRNTVEVASDSSASIALPNTELYYECAYLTRCAGFGASLSTGEQTALYNRLVTLMTAIVGGVP